ncbi:hypothetical protein [Clostridium intestinale]|uniref:hypothetical protein n=1 Tax=Clostridium intestinale TaxID=36845 RepID=UPI0028EDC52C|nr:hypothetical protein [Clostridium intestinale]
MFKVEKAQTTINERVFDIPDFVVTDLFELVNERLREHQLKGETNLEFEELLKESLEIVEEDYIEDKIECELNTLEDLGYTLEDLENLNNEDVEKIVWGK